MQARLSEVAFLSYECSETLLSNLLLQRHHYLSLKTKLNDKYIALINNKLLIV